jgi:hypothetical protein
MHHAWFSLFEYRCDMYDMSYDVIRRLLIFSLYTKTKDIPIHRAYVPIRRIDDMASYLSGTA